MTATDDHAADDLLRDFDAAFAAGDADRFAALFTEGAQVLLLNREALEGRAAIHEFWTESSARVDTSDWNPVTERVDVHDDDAYVLRTYTERLRDRRDGSRTLVRGRLVYFLRRDEEERWRIRLLMNSHSHPMEPIE